MILTYYYLKVIIVTNSSRVNNMKILEKLFSKKGQVSMEIGILVAAAVAVAAIAAYYYVTNVKNSASSAGTKATETTTKLSDLAGNATNGIPSEA